jgi:NhaP-type Na+/H+ or K+/H+ antiporter
MTEHMIFTYWFILIGLLLIAMAIFGSILRRLPVSSAMLYMAVGLGIGPGGLGLIRMEPVSAAGFLERFTEVAVIVSLFTAGLKLRVPVRDARWHIPLRLAFGSMTITVGLVALAGVVGMGLPIGAAILLGAILAPTDPVLASDVQVENPWDGDRLRFSLTAEAGLNDGTAFPFVMLGLGLLGLHDIGTAGWRWLAIDVAWGIVGGLAIGAGLGWLVSHLVVYLRKQYREAVGLDDFLALGLISLSYGVALLAHAYGFLAVFAAGLALRSFERETTEVASSEEDKQEVADVPEELATHPTKAASYMAAALLGFNEQLEHILELAVVLLLGGMLTRRDLPAEALWFIPLLLLVIRPVSVSLGLYGSLHRGYQRGLMSWFGIRGIGSIYYLMYAIEHGLPGPLAERMTNLTLCVVATSIVVHGISVTPLMTRYRRRVDERAGAEAPS